MEIGKFYEIKFGNGTQLIYVYEKTKSGSFRIARCEAWKTLTPQWNIEVSTIKADDRRIGREFDRNPIGAQPYSLLEVTTWRQAKAEIDREFAKRVKAQVAKLNEIEIDPGPCAPRPAYTWAACDPSKPHFVESRFGPNVGSHAYHCPAHKALNRVIKENDVEEERPGNNTYRKRQELLLLKASR